MDESVVFRLEPADAANLRRLWDDLRHAKATGTLVPEDLRWLQYFPLSALRRFRWTPAAHFSSIAPEWVQWLLSWAESTRWYDQELVGYSDEDTGIAAKWDFLSMLEAVVNGDYALMPLETTEDGRFGMRVQPYGWPFGGVGCLSAMADALGGTEVEIR